MTTAITEPSTAETNVRVTRRHPKKKATATPHRRPGSPKKVKPSNKAASAEKAPKARKNTPSARQNSKTQKVIDLLKAPGGATLNQLMKATSWQAHSVRGFLSGTLGKRMGLTVTSVKTEDGERTYSIKA
jgi:hypothetical protein